MTKLKQLEAEVKVGIFVVLGIALVMIAILVLGSSENLLSRRDYYTIHFQNVDGLIPGSKIVLGGIQVGSIESIDVDIATRDIVVRIEVARKYEDLIRKDSTAELATQGLLGDKFITLTMGDRAQPVLPAESDIPVHSSTNLTQFISKGDTLLVSLNSIAGSLDRLLHGFESGNRSEDFFQGMASSAKNLSQATEKMNKAIDDTSLRGATRNLNAILDKINSGEGTLGALINDPDLYDEAKEFVGGANRNRVLRNLVRQTIQDGEPKQPPSQKAGQK